jgi:hypothetical protein
MEVFEMAVEEKKEQTSEQTVHEEIAEDFPNELREPLWSVISFEKCEANGLTYEDATRKIAELDAQKVPGLCIVTDEVAARIAPPKA